MFNEITLKSIQNDTEFYSSSYLSTVAASIVTEQVKSWELAGLRPHDALRGLAAAWRKTIGAANESGELGSANSTPAVRRFLIDLFTALGYSPQFEVEIAGESAVPTLHADDRIWIVEVPYAPLGKDDGSATHLLDRNFSPDQFPEAELARMADGKDMYSILDAVFSSLSKPRYVVLASLDGFVLVDERKWASRRHLGVDFEPLFASDPDAFKFVAALLHETTVNSKEKRPVIDRLEDETQQHANAVTGELKQQMRDAIEILGNEVLDLRYPNRNVQSNYIDAADLTRECLHYMYRLLFLFYAEANPQLGFAPMSKTGYRAGYSIDMLRAAVQLDLSPVEEEQTSIGDTVDALIRMMHAGVHPKNDSPFSIPRIDIDLIDPSKTPMISALRLRNKAMQDIIRKMSIGTIDGRKRRIDYAQLGISQLGAVYETLLSFTGTIASTNLVEVRPNAKARKNAEPAPEADSDEDPEELLEETPKAALKYDSMEAAYFVPESRMKEFSLKELVLEDGRPRIIPRGTFMYRLSGRDRQKSASYYTPEPLARFLVKQTLKDVIADKSAADLLKLSILEPAMGSAAFLVETVNQLADAYIEKTIAETGEEIPLQKLISCRQRVRAYISEHCVYGVDLNPVAVELGKISLWLGCLHADRQAPWYGDQLHAGNSLVGARRAAYDFDQVVLTQKNGAYQDKKEVLSKAQPHEIGWSKERSDRQIWQFLLPDPMMASYAAKEVGDLVPEEFAMIEAWRDGDKNDKGRRIPGTGFFRSLTRDQGELLVTLSRVVDDLFLEVAEGWRSFREKDTGIDLRPDSPDSNPTEDHAAKDRRLEAFLGRGGRSASAYKRLRAVMDIWCSLFYWPITKAKDLPSLEDYLMGLDDILTKNTAAQTRGDLTRLDDDIDIGVLTTNVPWMKIALVTAERHRFMHYDLMFADVLQEREGFDVILGNPPWMKPDWVDTDIVSEMEPLIIAKGWSTQKVSATKKSILSQDRKHLQTYLSLNESVRGLVAFTSNARMQPFVGGGRNNLYRCFIDLTFRLLAPNGRAGLVHQDNHLTDPKSSKLRGAWYRRTVLHVNFKNMISSAMFAEVNAQLTFSINVYRGHDASVSFHHMSSVFLPSQVEESLLQTETLEAVPAQKDEAGNWITRGHRDRVIHVDENVLATLSSLTSYVPEVDDEDEAAHGTSTSSSGSKDGAPLVPPFVMPYSRGSLDIFERLTRSGRTIGNSCGRVRMSSMWNETTSQDDGTIVRDVDFHAPADAVLTGPTFHLGNPLYKSARSGARTPKDYDNIDLASIPDAFTGRTVYRRAVGQDEYRARMESVPWDKTTKHGETYRICFRAMMSLGSERTLIPAIIPPGIAHVHSIESVAFEDPDHLSIAAALTHSIVYDAVVKATKMNGFHERNLLALPCAELPSRAIDHVLRLNCLTSAYADLWSQFRNEPWEWSTPYRDELTRRNALIEIDIMVSKAFGIELEELIEIYRTMFPGLQQNEAGTWYDSNGRIGWTSGKGYTNAGHHLDGGMKPSRKEWEEILASGQTRLVSQVPADFRPEGGFIERILEGPFTRYDRIEDYRRLWDSL